MIRVMYGQREVEHSFSQYNYMGFPIAGAIIKVSGHQYRWLAGGYDLELGYFQKWLARWLIGG